MLVCNFCCDEWGNTSGANFDLATWRQLGPVPASVGRVWPAPTEFGQSLAHIGFEPDPPQIGHGRRSPRWLRAVGVVECRGALGSGNVGGFAPGHLAACARRGPHYLGDLRACSRSRSASNVALGGQRVAHWWVSPVSEAMWKWSDHNTRSGRGSPADATRAWPGPELLLTLIIVARHRYSQG